MWCMMGLYFLSLVVLVLDEDNYFCSIGRASIAITPFHFKSNSLHIEPPILQINLLWVINNL